MRELFVSALLSLALGCNQAAPTNTPAPGNHPAFLSSAGPTDIGFIGVDRGADAVEIEVSTPQGTQGTLSLQPGQVGSVDCGLSPAWIEAQPFDTTKGIPLPAVILREGVDYINGQSHVGLVF